MSLPAELSSLNLLKLTLRPVKQGSYLLLGLNNAPVNAMTKNLWSELTKTLEVCERPENKIRGLIFYSCLSKPIFTAGNDLMELYAPKTTQERYYDFWILQTNFLARLYKSPLVTIAALRGYVPAGGCGLALCCDYRVMLDGSSIGLNEVGIGILVPKFWAQLMLKVSPRSEFGLITGKMFPAEEALQMGLVHEVESGGEEALLPRSEEVMKQVLELPDKGRQLTKWLMREKFANEWEAYGPTEAEEAWKMLNNPEIVKALGYAMKKLFGNKSKL